ncbi:receptor-type tyrosine-protein phosphatase epsilon [Ciona intestinalis]
MFILSTDNGSNATLFSTTATTLFVTMTSQSTSANNTTNATTTVTSQTSNNATTREPSTQGLTTQPTTSPIGTTPVGTTPAPTTTAAPTTTPVSTTTPVPTPPKDNSTTILAVVLTIFGLILILFIILLYCYCYDKGGSCSRRVGDEDIPLNDASGRHRKSVHGKNKVFPVGNMAIGTEEFATVYKNKSADDNRNFRMEFQAVQSGVSDKTEALKSVNLIKNRYDNVVPYDVTRVVITPGSDPTETDYINANYVSGYMMAKKWIACQGPKKETINDFWKMIWEQNCATIIMVTRLVENGKPKCDQYWPGEKEIYGDYDVTLVEEKNRNFFVVRRFQIKHGDVERSVTQFHYISWPDFGVPSNAAHLLKFRRRVCSSNPCDAGPIVIHCSAGVGRTGTYILIDAALEQIKKEGKTDLFTLLNNMRKERMMLVQTDPQYAFAHKAVLEQINFGVTEVPAAKFKKQVYELREGLDSSTESLLEMQFKKLLNIPIHKDNLKHGRRSLKKNRVLQIIPYDSNRVMLPRKPGNEHSDYINASYIDGFEKAQTFIATQGPMQETAEDFWTMIWDKQLTTIVMLTRLEEKGINTCYKYWPSLNEGTIEYGDITITFVTEEDDDVVDYVVREFKISSSQVAGVERLVRQFHYQAWPDIGSGSPKDAQGLIEIVARVARDAQSDTNKPPTVVHCSSGGGRTGVYCCLTILIEELEKDGTVDVFQTVRHLREQRPHIIQNQEQLYFCYLSLLQYLESNQVSDSDTTVSNIPHMENLTQPTNQQLTSSMNNQVDFTSMMDNDDVINTSSNDDVINTSSNDDVINTSSNDDVINTSSNDDLINTSSNDDVISSSSNDDVMIIENE